MVHGLWDNCDEDIQPQDNANSKLWHAIWPESALELQVQ